MKTCGNTSVVLTLVKKNTVNYRVFGHLTLKTKPWYLQWFLLETVQKHSEIGAISPFFHVFRYFLTCELVRYTWLSNSSRFFFRQSVLADVFGLYGRHHWQ